MPQHERIKTSNPVLIHQSQTDPYVPPKCPPPLIPFPPASYLEGILLCKVQNHVPPLPSGIGGIKHLEREPHVDEQKVRNGIPPWWTQLGLWSLERVETKAGERCVRLTAICPLSSVRYALTSFSATTAHCLP